MSMFRKERVVGTVRLDFHSHNDVSVADTVPFPSSDNPAATVFPFAFAAKMLFNFPPPTGMAALDHALSVLPDVGAENMAHDVPLLGTCCEQALHIVDMNKPGKWVYETKMTLPSSSEFRLETKAACGDEDHFHRASIDVTWEWFRRKWNIGGGFMCIFVKEFYKKLKEQGIEDLPRNHLLSYEMAGSFYMAVATAKRG